MSHHECRAQIKYPTGGKISAVDAGRWSDRRRINGADEQHVSYVTLGDADF
jgi:hypothetical protein